MREIGFLYGNGVVVSQARRMSGGERDPPDERKGHCLLFEFEEERKKKGQRFGKD
jgi:hypothetical protein